jgi:general secretion pathway protein J
MSRAAHRRGFTLLEMLMAMALVGMLAAALYGSLSIAFRGRRVSDAALEPVRRAAAAMTLVGGGLEAAVPPTGLLAAEFLGEDVKGENGEPSDVLLFHALAQDQSDTIPPSPMSRIEFLLATDEKTSETVLVRRTTPSLLYPEEVAPTEDVVCRRVRSFDTAYFDGTDWVDSWDSTARGNVLPAAVRVSLVIEADGRENGYAVTDVFALPCFQAPQEQAPQSEAAPR